jgi:CrcB protein
MAGGALGTGARFLLSGWAAARFGEFFPWGTMLINVTGSFAITFFDGLTAPEGTFAVPVTGRQFFMTGICGGYTTFSSFSLQTLKLAQDGEWLWAGGNAACSLILCLLAAWLGRVAALLLNRARGR